MNEIETRHLDSQAMSALEAAMAMTVVSHADYVRAGAAREALKCIERQIDDTFDSLIKQAHSHHKALVAEKAKHAAPIEQARGLIKSLMFHFEDEIEKARKVEEFRLQAEAKKRAEDDLIAAAEKAKAEGRHDEAEAILSEPVATPVVVVPSSTPKVMGHTRRMIRKFRITDPHLINRDFLMPDEVKIGGVVRSLGKAAEKVIGGIETYEVPC